MTSKLTRERLQEIADDGFLKHGESKELARMALAAMDSEPVGKPFMYGIADPDGNAYIDDFCVSEDFGLVEDTVNELNYDREEGDELNYSVVALYRHAQPAPDQMLCDFYEVNSWPDLVRELVKHVEQLQDSAKRNVKPWEDTFPETLLPAYIERVKQADEACRAAMLQAEPVCTCPSGNGSLRWPCPVHPGNSPAIPDGYVMVPKEPTKEMINAGWLYYMGTKNPSSKGTYKAMLAATQQEVKGE